MPEAVQTSAYEKMLRACVDTGRVSFIKDICCDTETIKERVELLRGSGVRLYNANAQTLLETVRAGADGYCGVMANLHPEIYRGLLDNAEKPCAETVQAFAATAAFTESLAYPVTAKYYLKRYENMDILPLSRTADCKLVTEYQKSCLAQMKTLGEYIGKHFGIAKR